MKYTITAVFISFLFAFIDAQACYSARQTRLFPLGIIGDKVVALNLVMHRGHEIPDTAKVKTDDPWWHGTARLVLFDVKDYTIKSTYVSHSVAWSETNEMGQIEQLYHQALNSAIAIGGFQPFKPDHISMCNFRQSCKVAAVTNNGDSTKGYIKHQSSGKLYDVSNVSMQDSSTVIYYFGAEGPDTYFPDRLSEGNLVDIGSTRTFTISNRRLLAVNINTGQKFEDEDGNPEPTELEYTPNHPKFDTLENCAYIEPLLHHGTSVDLPIWLN